MSKDTDVHLATITTELKCIREDIAEIKEFQITCPVHELNAEVAKHAIFFRICIYIISGSGFLGVLGLIGRKLML